MVTGWGGKGIVAGFSWFHFKYGEGFVEEPVSALREKYGYAVRYLRDSAPADFRHLRSIVGGQWSLWNNCTTRLFRYG